MECIYDHKPTGAKNRLHDKGPLQVFHNAPTKTLFICPQGHIMKIQAGKAFKQENLREDS